MLTIRDFAPKQRVQMHPATDLWMRGARYGDVTEVGRKYVRVRLDRLGKTVLVSPSNILEIL